MKKSFILFFLLSFVSLSGYATPPFIEGSEDEKCPFYIGSWSHYRFNYGMEKVNVRFPHNPHVIQENGLLTASATEHKVLYKFIGYFPPIGNIDPHHFFKRELHHMSTPPLALISHSTYQVSNGDWVLDFVTHDAFANVTIKQRSIVTPFNAYTLTAVFPYGHSDRFDYFLESFRVHCTCED